MVCRVDGCDREEMYKNDKLCQMHYFRKMRTGSFELQKKRKYRRQNPAGYFLVFEPGHPLSQAGGYVYEHRFVVYSKYGDSLPGCDLCGKPTEWETCHIDHIDEDVTNNKLENLRPVCRPCNTLRGRIKTPEHEYKGATGIECDGQTMTVAEWARQEGVTVSGNCIRNRIAKGWDIKDAIYKPSLTHKKPAKKTGGTARKKAEEIEQEIKYHKERVGE